MRLIVGLGNPGSQYAPTRHNVGAWLVAALGEQANWQTSSKFHAQIAEIHPTPDQTTILAIPTTFMNDNGKTVAALANFYKIAPDDILIVHDELDLPVGTVRLKLGGGHGGHNGLRDIIEKIGSSDFYRLRIGIGHPGDRDKVTPYVLNKPSVEEHVAIVAGIRRVLDNQDLLLAKDISKAMTVLHTD